MITKTVPQHTIYAIGLIATVCFVFFRVFLNTKPTLAYVLLSLAIACGLIVFYLHRRNDTRKNDDTVDKTIQKEFILACNSFRKAFVPEYTILDSMINKGGKKPYIYIMLRDARIKHRTAVMEFMIFLSDKQKIALRKAWIEYSGEDYDKKGKDRPFYYIKEFEPTKTSSELAMIIRHC